MASFEYNAQTREFTNRGRLDPDAFRESSTGKSTLILSGSDTQILGANGVRGSLNLYTKSPDALVAAK